MGRITRIAAASAAVAGLAVGSAGIAGAATSGSPASGSPASGSTVNCAKAPQALTRIANRQAKLQTLNNDVQGWASQAQSGGFTGVSKRLTALSGRIQKRESRLTTRQQKITAACPGTSASGGSSS